MSDQQISATPLSSEEKIDRVYESVEQVRRYMFWSLVLQLAVVLLPIVVFMLAIPFILSSLSNLSNLYQGI